MAEREQYLVRVKGKLVEVTPEVYYAFYRMKRQEEWQQEKKKDHNVTLCCDLDTEYNGPQEIDHLFQINCEHGKIKQRHERSPYYVTREIHTGI